MRNVELYVQDMLAALESIELFVGNVTYDEFLKYPGGRWPVCVTGRKIFRPYGWEVEVGMVFPGTEDGRVFRRVGI